MKQKTPDNKKKIEKEDLIDIMWHLEYVMNSLKIYGKEPIDVDFYIGHAKKAVSLMEKYQGGQK